MSFFLFVLFLLLFVFVCVCLFVCLFVVVVVFGGVFFSLLCFNLKGHSPRVQ